MNWFRVPLWLGVSPPDESLAALWLLHRWHAGADPSVAEMKLAWGWGWDRCATFARRLWTWAGEDGARRPETLPGKSGSNRGASVGKSGRLYTDATPKIDESPGDTGEASGSNRGASYVRDSVGERDEIPREIETQTPIAPAAFAGPPPAAPNPVRAVSISETTAPTLPAAAHAPSLNPSGAGGAPSVTSEAAGDPAPTAVGIPSWVPSAAKDRGRHPPAAVHAMVLRCVEHAKQGLYNPAKCATDAAPILALWRKLDYPDPVEFAAEFGLVAAAARDCTDRLFARDIRGENWEGAADRSAAVATLAVQQRWSDRLAAAQAWAARGRTEIVNGHSGPGSPATNGHRAPAPSRMEPIAAGLARFVARHTPAPPGADHAIPDRHR